MIEGQRELTPRRCPRCSGLMAKPAGSPYYWHADYNHPPCEITNVIDPPLAVQTVEEITEQETPPKRKHPKK
ncbi:MAG TPA: hypothetical protein DDW33_11730 [Ktedonobacter sp.]|jgi:hypothetical protein|nr:hypothetical protein [Ktedonobacter sp.]HAG98313.1 hypothetical protein [Ktedonobacter sp.]HAT47134.1 hypothetical protein [Ktedonobacter sp.]HBE26344.1 hypothetical protein [Ktedonobacter sp.]HCF87560.1 hypothetical protein [Ktedonobacter sp.]